MFSPLDRQLWRFYHQGYSTMGFAWPALLGALVVAIVMWSVVERRSRSLWQKTPAPEGDRPLGDGPYRQATVDAFLTRAPALTRVASFVGVLVGVLGLLWPALIVADLPGVASPAMLLEVLGAAAATLSLLSALAMLRKRDSFGRKEARIITIAAALYLGLSLAFLVGALGGLEVEVAQIKSRETMTLARFMTTGFYGTFGGHHGMTWRLLLRTSALYGVLCALYLLLWRAVIVRRDA